MPTNATPTAGSKLIWPKDHTLIMIDFQSQMSFATKLIDAVLLRNNAALVAHAAKDVGISTILTTVAEKSLDFEVYAIADACGDVSDEAHDRAMERMIQAGVQPMTRCNTC